MRMHMQHISGKLVKRMSELEKRPSDLPAADDTTALAELVTRFLIEDVNSLLDEMCERLKKERIREDSEGSGDAGLAMSVWEELAKVGCNELRIAIERIARPTIKQLATVCAWP